MLTQRATIGTMELAVSIFAAVIALAALGWQAYEWKRSGARPRLSGAVFQQGANSPDLVLTVVNAGRSSCQVVAIQLRAVDGRLGFDPSSYAHAENATLPLQLDAGNLVELRYSASKIAQALSDHSATNTPFLVSALLGDGTTHNSKGTLLIPSALIDPAAPPIQHKSEVVRVLSRTRPQRRKR